MSGEGLPFRRLLGMAVVGLGWCPADFWNATPQDLAAALDFLAETQSGLNPDMLADLRRGLQEGQWNSTS